MALLHDLSGKRDCNSCGGVNRKLENRTDKDIIKQRKTEARRLNADPDYVNVKFNKKNGGLMATHINHIEHEAKEETFFNGMTSTDLEKECQNELFRMGHKSILANEKTRGVDGNYMTSLDMNLNDTMVDIASVCKDSLYGNRLINKNKQLIKYNKRSDVDIESDAMILYFHDPSFFSEEKMQKSINYFKHYRNSKGQLIEKKLKKIHCVFKDADNIVTYTIE